MVAGECLETVMDTTRGLGQVPVPDLGSLIMSEGRAKGTLHIEVAAVVYDWFRSAEEYAVRGMNWYIGLMRRWSERDERGRCGY